METFSTLLALCAGNLPVTSDFPSQRPVTRSFDIFFDLRLNKRLSKQSRRWWFGTLFHSLWRHCDAKTLNLQMSCSDFTPYDITGCQKKYPSNCLQATCPRIHWPPGNSDENVNISQIIYCLIWDISCKIAQRWMSLNLSDDKSTLDQVVAWCPQWPLLLTWFNFNPSMDK